VVAAKYSKVIEKVVEKNFILTIDSYFAKE
jgi:hypothetical protein